jgi:hypothetical protein
LWGQPTNGDREEIAAIRGYFMRIYAEDRPLPLLPPASSAGLTAPHFDQKAIERAAVVLKIGARYSRDDLDHALAAARRAFLYSLEEADADVHAGQAVFDALEAAAAISQYRA